MPLLDASVPSLAGVLDDGDFAVNHCDTDLDGVPTVTYNRADILDAILDAYNEACEPNWDGEGARAVPADVLVMACRFLLALPVDTPAPEVDASPHGTLLFSWYAASRRRMTVDVDGSGELAFAAMLGHDRVRGTMLFVDSVPEGILRLATRVAYG